MTLPEFVEPWEPELDLAAAQYAGTPPEVIAIARELAAADGRDRLRPEDLAGAQSEYERGRRRVLH